MRGRTLPVVFAIVLVVLIFLTLMYFKSVPEVPVPQASPTETSSIASPAPSPTDSMTPAPISSGTPNPVDFSVSSEGLSKTTAVVRTTKGVIKYKFYPEDAPNTSRRIAELIQQGFYNGTIFHRVERGFVIQSGDPSGTGAGGSGQTIKAEFNKRRHSIGAVGLARTSNPDSGDSQYYICLGAQPQLDNAYTIFGQVIEGMDVAQKIEKGDKVLSITLE